MRRTAEGSSSGRARLGRDIAGAGSDRTAVYLQLLLEHVTVVAQLSGPDAYTAPMAPYLSIGWQLMPQGLPQPSAATLQGLLNTHPGLPNATGGAAGTASSAAAVTGTGDAERSSLQAAPAPDGVDIPVPDSDQGSPRSQDSFQPDNSPDGAGSSDPTGSGLATPEGER